MSRFKNRPILNGFAVGQVRGISFCTAVLTLLAGAAVQASSITGPYSVTVHGFPENYYVITGSSGATYDLLRQSSWISDEAEAHALGTNLITVGTAAQNSTLLSDVAQNFSGSVSGLNLSVVPLWLGLNDEAHDPLEGGTDDMGTAHAGDFSWADGSNSAYRNWTAGEPNDNGSGEYYTALDWRYAQTTSNPYGTWDDVPDSGTTGDGGNTGNSAGYYGVAAVPVPEPASILIVAVSCLLPLRRHR
jgi:hypothetical protein